MNIRLDERANRILAYCIGRLDAEGGQALEKQLLPVLEGREGLPFVPVLVDLSGVEYLSSAGIRSMLVLSRASRHGGLPQARFVNPSAFVRDVLETVSLAGSLAGLVERRVHEAPGSERPRSYLQVLETVRQPIPAPGPLSLGSMPAGLVAPPSPSRVPRLAEAAEELSTACASLVGYDPAVSSGVFTFGSTGTLLHGVRVGIEKAQPGAFEEGLGSSGAVGHPLRVVSSCASRPARLTAEGWLGLGTRSDVRVPTDQDDSMGLIDLETTLHRLLDDGQRIACIVCTVGTPDAFGIDNVEYTVRLRDRVVEEYGLPYRPHVHADAIVGWAWSAFGDYDFEANPLDFSARARRALWDVSHGVRSLALADSIGIDFHAGTFLPALSGPCASLFLVRDGDDLSLLRREEDDEAHLLQWGVRMADASTDPQASAGSILSALCRIRQLGRDGLRALIGHLVTLAEALRARLEETGRVAIVNEFNHGPVTLFRVYPPVCEPRAMLRRELSDAASRSVAEENDACNRAVFAALEARNPGHFRLVDVASRCDLSPLRGVVSILSPGFSPFAEETAVAQVVDQVLASL